MPLAPATILTIVNGAIGTSRMAATARTPPRWTRADAVEAGAKHTFHVAAPQPGANEVRKNGARKTAGGSIGKAENRPKSCGRAGDQQDQGKRQKPAEHKCGDDINGRPGARGKAGHGGFDRLTVEKLRQRREFPGKGKAKDKNKRRHQLGSAREPESAPCGHSFPSRAGPRRELDARDRRCLRCSAPSPQGQARHRRRGAGCALGRKNCTLRADPEPLGRLGRPR